MPNSATHVNLAMHNIELACMLNNHPKHHDWMATVSFYAALHVVEALYACQSPVFHGQGHERREAALKRDGRYKQIYRHYRRLWNASTIARYLDDGTRSYETFHDYFSPEEVRTLLMQHHLLSILQSAAKLNLLPQTSRELIKKAEASVRQLRPPT